MIYTTYRLARRFSGHPRSLPVTLAHPGVPGYLGGPGVPEGMGRSACAALRPPPDPSPGSPGPVPCSPHKSIRYLIRLGHGTVPLRSSAIRMIVAERSGFAACWQICWCGHYAMRTLQAKRATALLLHRRRRRIAKGGHVTNSPPAKIHDPSLDDHEPARILASGIDSLVLSLDLSWSGSSFLERLAEWQKQADENHPAPGQSDAGTEVPIWRFNVLNHGSKGYAFLLVSHDLTVKLMNQLEPGPRPNALIEFRSEMLWREGYMEAISFIMEHLSAAGATIERIKPSRIDLCVDVLLREADWSEAIRDQAVTRATRRSSHDSGSKLSGFSFGKGQLVGRLYDKPLEIAQQSGKRWMFDIWGLLQVPEAHRVIRVEFQIRREKLKAMGIETMGDLDERLTAIWRYASEQWFKLQDGAGLQSHQRTTLAWWQLVQSGFLGSQDPRPIILTKAVSGDIEGRLRQVLGGLSSLKALCTPEEKLADGDVTTLREAAGLLLRLAETHGISDEAFTLRIHEKIAKNHRIHWNSSRPESSDELSSDTPF